MNEEDQKVHSASISEDDYTNGLFKIVDSDRDGYLNLEEFKILSRLLNMNLNDQELKIEFDALDENEDEKISKKGIFNYNKRELKISSKLFFLEFLVWFKN